tara:strand:+ start:2119 stop:3225 length:1107 start_codon:yes stop_codon:yes gene_type:complete
MNTDKPPKKNMPKKPVRVAVIIYGEARHIKESAKSIREEFDIDGCRVDFFYHSWPYIGYHWSEEIGKRKNPNKEKIADLYQKLYEPVSGYVSEDDDDVIDFCNKINQAKDLLGERGVYQKTLLSLPHNWANSYNVGQFFSLGKAIQLKIDYEKKHNFIYDAVYRVRTDMFYKGIEFYQNKLLYRWQKRHKLNLIMQNPNCVISSDAWVKPYAGEHSLEYLLSNTAEEAPRIDRLYWKSGIPQAQLYRKRLNACFKDSDVLLVSGREAASSSETSNKCWLNIPDVYLLHIFSENIKSYFGERPPFYRALWGEALEGQCLLRNKIGFISTDGARHMKIVKKNKSIGSNEIVAGSYDEMVRQASKVWRRFN